MNKLGYSDISMKSRASNRSSSNTALGLFIITLLLATRFAYAQSNSSKALWPDTVALKNNNPRIDPAILKGALDKSSRMTFDVVLAPRNKDQLDTLIEDQQNPASPSYHRWLTGDQFNARFGPNAADYAAVAQWLKRQGFLVVEIDQQSRYIRCTGTAGQVDATFNAAMASAGLRLFTNTADPLIPARFDGVIGSIQGLDNLHASYSNLRKYPPPTPPSPAAKSTGISGAKKGTAQPNTTYGGKTAFAPQDLQIYYDSTPVLNAGITGAGDCIAVIEDSDYLPAAVALFNSTFGAPVVNVTKVLSSNAKGTYTNPGINSDESEGLLDVEWLHAAVPGAAIRYYLGDDNNSVNGGVVDALAKAVSDNVCSVIAMSFDFCGSNMSNVAAFFAPTLAQAAAQGQSVLIATGDQGAAGIVYSSVQQACVTGTSLNVPIPASDPNATAVGGTSFTPNFGGVGGVVTGTINDTPSMVWNDLGSGGGGLSFFSAKPSYQAATTPIDGARDLPDISAIASLLYPGAFLGDDSSGTAVIDCCWGGTSLSAQVMAGFTKLIEQKSHNRLGRINDKLYQLASSANAVNNGYRDVTSGTNSYNGVTGYSASSGYDLATGWGEVDVNQFVTSFLSSFFNGEAALGGGWYYLTFSNNTAFGYYSYMFYPWLFHADMGFEYFVDGQTPSGGVYLYDAKLAQWFYTDTNNFPFLYNFIAGAWYYYFPDGNNPGHYSTNPRVFENMTTKQVIFS